MKEKKDKTIERAFRGYFDGLQPPPCDLTRAKQALPQPGREKRRGRVLKIAAACAGFLIVFAASASLLFVRRGGIDSSDWPGTTYYALASAQAAHPTYAQLLKDYGPALSGLAPFEWADNAQADYTLYAAEGEAVLIGVNLKYLRGLFYWEGTLYVDLTGGTRLPEELKPFEELSQSGSVGGRPYTYSTRYLNGEYVSDARLSLPFGDCYMTVMGQDQNAVFFLLRLLAGEG